MYLYLIGVEPNGPVKIGVSSNVISRLRALQTGFHLDLSIIKKWKANPENLYRIEAITHNALKAHRLRGEWFSCHSLQAITEIETILFRTKNGRDVSCYEDNSADPFKSLSSSVGGKISAAKRKKISKTSCAKIADRWVLSNKDWPTHVLLKEADLSYNTAIKFLGKRPIAQWNYLAKMKRKARKSCS